MNVIELRGIGKTFTDRDEPTVALEHVNLTIKTGEFVAIIGPSGSGKSTLMNILGLLDVPSDGEYLLDGEAVTNFHDRQLAKLRREKIGFVFQTFNLLPRLSVVQNVELPLVYAGLRGRKRRARALDELRRLNRVTHATIVIVTHNPEIAAQTDRVVTVRDGRILSDEPTHDHTPEPAAPPVHRPRRTVNGLRRKGDE
jgi:putative ABC transport system ATP-binding protein